MKKIITLATAMLLAASIAAPAGASDINKGRAAYKKHCATCHGSNGKPTMAGAADFSRGQGLMKSDKDLVKRIERGNRACPAYRGILSEQRILDVIAYTRTLM